MPQIESKDRADIQLGHRSLYEDQSWDRLPPTQLTAELQQVAAHLRSWFRQPSYELEQVYHRTIENREWTDLAFVLTPHSLARVLRTMQHLDPIKPFGDDRELRALVRFPKDQVRDDGGVWWWPTISTNDRHGGIHPKNLGPFVGYHGLWLREKVIEKIDDQKTRWLKDLDSPHVVSWVNFKPLPMVRTKMNTYDYSRSQFIKTHEEDPTKVVFEAALANVKPMIQREIAIRQGRPNLRPGATDTSLLEEVLVHFQAFPDLIPLSL